MQADMIGIAGYCIREKAGLVRSFFHLRMRHVLYRRKDRQTVVGKEEEGAGCDFVHVLTYIMEK